MKKTFRLVGLLALIGGLTFATSCSKGTKMCECKVSVTIMGHTQSQTARGETEGDCDDIPELKDAKEALSGIGTLKIDCREI